MTQLGTPGMQKGELLELCLALPLRHLPFLIICHKLVPKEGDFPEEEFGILMSRC
jgi:hypothetical protein